MTNWLIFSQQKLIFSAYYWQFLERKNIEREENKIDTIYHVFLNLEVGFGYHVFIIFFGNEWPIVNRQLKVWSLYTKSLHNYIDFFICCTGCPNQYIYFWVCDLFFEIRIFFWLYACYFLSVCTWSSMECGQSGHLEVAGKGHCILT